MRRFLAHQLYTAQALIVSLGLLTACQRPLVTTSPATTLRKSGMASAAVALPNPVLPGDFPDPSVTKVGTTYWATATSSNWGPAFPLLKSSNLTSWELVGHVFPDGPPGWADYYFWAPEISQEKNKTYVYYTAHRRGGNLAVGVASATNPAGPYTDHGPLVGQPHGSIDGFPMRDEKGELYLIWKEDGNSVQEPTPIWAQRMNEERTALVGEKVELFRNDASTWEGNLVEGVSMVRHDGYFYAFYAANGCCGSGCTYATGVARAENLLGPWEKYTRNPVLMNNDTWKCPGHGTVVEDKGRWYLLHHAYNNDGRQFVGRQGVLSEFVWTESGWPTFKGGSTPVSANPLFPRLFTDDFKGAVLQPSWQWPIEQRPAFSLQGGQLHLTARPDHSGAALGQSVTSPNFIASTTLTNYAALPAGAHAGLAVHGDEDNTLALLAGNGKIQLARTEKGQLKVLEETALPATKTVLMMLDAKEGSRFAFVWSADGGQNWHKMPADGTKVDGSYLPPWDRGIRAGLLVKGPNSAEAVFEDFKLTSSLSK
ncbi:family 43 glycosylhydrolase [Hymenobacter sp. BT730]|uniref:family 43 glycosylhydrolase n=1 Tax=Hymenobacter sp. BT730 TaxID=3063332 RepID=UPI0026E0AAFB|nr:family 43 glycosylhydrolase [Hymenobacter sp. BT730]